MCVCVWFSYGRDHLAGAQAVVEAHPVVELGVLSLVEHVLVAVEVGLLVGHPVAPHDAQGVAAPEVAEGVGAVPVALPGCALEVAAFVEDDLSGEEKTRQGHRAHKGLKV